jgi:DNA-binding beta-propeller fold protein YncE
MKCVLTVFLSLAVAGCAREPAGQAVALPESSPGIGFDDLRYSASLHRLLVPGGRSGRLNLVNPDTPAVTSIPGFSTLGSYEGGHDDGPTSAEEADGRVYVTDRTSRTLLVVDPEGETIVGSTPLAAQPDYVRYVAQTNELWVSEPGGSQLEIFKLGTDGMPTHDGVIPVDNGPESLVVDPIRGRIYTHRWQRSTLAIDVETRTIVAEWLNGCAASRGIALDETRGFLFSGCSEGTAAVLDVAHDGRILSTIARGAGFDVIGYSPALGHLYLAGSACACLVLLGVDARGGLSFLDRLDAPSSTHCAAADDVGHAWVCDPDEGRLFRIDDRHPGSFR